MVTFSGASMRESLSLYRQTKALSFWVRNAIDDETPPSHDFPEIVEKGEKVVLGQTINSLHQVTTSTTFGKRVTSRWVPLQACKLTRRCELVQLLRKVVLKTNHRPFFSKDSYHVWAFALFHFGKMEVNRSWAQKFWIKMKSFLLLTEKGSLFFQSKSKTKNNQNECKSKVTPLLCFYSEIVFHR